MTIRNPIEWTANKIGLVDRPYLARSSPAGAATTWRSQQPIRVQKIELHDLKDAFSQGFQDFAANRTDVIFLCLFYPLFGLLLARVASGSDLLPLLFPLASGLALLGPLAGVGLYEMSRRREQGLGSSWAAAFGVTRSPAFASILGLGLLLFVAYAAWLLTAWALYAATLGPLPPTSLSALVRDVFTTGPGWALLIAGVGCGFVYACIVLVLTGISFPLLLDRNVGVSRAIATSVQVARANPGPMAAWGLIVALSLLIGSIPAFFGLMVVLPLLGHTTWHLYRKLVV